MADHQILSLDELYAKYCDNPFNEFSEGKEAPAAIASLPQICDNQSALEASQQRFLWLLDKYQYLPQLLDPFLQQLISKLFEYAHPKTVVPANLRYQAFRYLYYISKARGPKVIVRWFSHEVADLLPVLELLEGQDRNDLSCWESPYILLLWLSIIVIMPFDLSRMDALGSGDKSHDRVMDRLYSVGKWYLGSAGKAQDSATLMLSKFLSRPDMMKEKGQEFIDWCFTILSTVDKTTIKGFPIVTGVLKTMAKLFKIAKREAMIPHGPRLLAELEKCGFAISINTAFRKLNMKLIQRIGMTFLAQRVTSWRYQRGLRSLAETLKAPNPTAQPQPKAAAEDEEYDIPDEIEEVLERLLNGLKDPDTVVRWSAAKGIGRLTGRLPKELADDVVGTLLELFSVRESDGAWHGGCLALAELGRRGLLLPQRLEQVVPVVLKALTYDERRGLTSVGTHVRDSACYICWSFARAYEPAELKPYVNSIACALLIETVFDREVNCRRAASAAFQENVGRQGTFPHGIDILTAADYFTVGSRQNSYIVLSDYIAQYNEYTRPLIDHLVSEKLKHWDIAVRDLAAEALATLTHRDIPYMRNTILPGLLPLVMSADSALQHGALRAVSEISHALFKLGSGDSHLTEALGDDNIARLLDIAPKLVAANAFKGMTGELFTPAVLRFIVRMCECGAHAHGPDVVPVWQGIIDDNLPHLQEHIREAAVTALTSLCVSHYCKSPENTTAVQKEIIPRYLSRLATAEDHRARMGFSLAIGGFPLPILKGKLSTIFSCLGDRIKTTNIHTKYTEPRRDAVLAVTRICNQLDVSCDESHDGSYDLCPRNLPIIFEMLFTAMKDYACDGRGDVGALVREASMQGLRDVLLKITDSGHQDMLAPEMCSNTVFNLIQQANEKIDRTRGVALTVLTQLLLHDPPIPHIPEAATLREIFTQNDVELTNWTISQTTFPLTVQLCGLPDYSYQTILGIIVSVGGLTESTVRYSSSSLLGYLRQVTSDPCKLDSFTKPLLQVFRDNQKNNRVILPLFKTLDLLLSNSVFEVFVSTKHVFPAELLSLMKEEVKKCKDATKILSSINVFCGLLNFPDVRQETLNHVMILLCHHFPAVRKTTADQLYITMVTYDDIIAPDVAEEVMSILSETAWDGPVPSVREQRNVICDLLQLPRPKVIAKAKSGKKAKPSDFESYRDLVDRAVEGY